MWVDDLESFAWLCPTLSLNADCQSVESIEVYRWRTYFPDVEVADVVIEAFACEIPPQYVAKMAARSTRPVWINLEYLSAEDWIEECHLVESPHPTLPLTKHFFFPGFTLKSGGLIRERNLIESRNRFDETGRHAFLSSIGVAPSADNELLVSLFCYDNPVLADLLRCWMNGHTPIRVLATPGFATQQIEAWLGHALSVGTSVQKNSLTIQPIPFLPQSDYDRLLWSCDLNFVRGEDSFVRAQWAGRPFVWQIYPQSEMTHLVKLDAFLSKYLMTSKDADLIRRFWRAWNGIGPISDVWPQIVEKIQSLEEHAKQWSDHLDRTGHLANNLVLFVQNRC